MKLTATLRRCLAEIASAGREHERYFGSAWVRSFDLSGTREERSSTTIRKLVALGLVEGRKPSGHRQTQWNWRITESGRRALAEGGGDG